MALEDSKRQNEPSHDDAPIKEKELAEVCARFADLCQYFSQQNIDLPAQIVDEYGHYPSWRSKTGLPG